MTAILLKTINFKHGCTSPVFDSYVGNNTLFKFMKSRRDESNLECMAFVAKEWKYKVSVFYCTCILTHTILL